MASTDTQPSLGPPARNRLRSRRFLALLAAGLVALAAILIVAVLTIPATSISVCACPAAWGAWGESHVLPGSAGCANVTGESCYTELMESSVGGVLLSGLKFAVLGPPTNNSNVMSGPPIPLGPAARLSVFDSDGSLVGVWNWTTSAWVQGGGWTIPVTSNITLVLDTGLLDAQLAEDWFFVFMTSPDYGSVGSLLR